MGKMAKFELISDFKPQGDQPQAIAELTFGLAAKEKHQVLLGVTGSGKTFTFANVIVNFGKPTLVISPNKTLAAQLYSELKAFFPYNAVEYFVSYYDYYQPEAYIPQTDTYIEKDASINDELDRLRLKATSSLLSRDDVIVVASVSSIYGLGSPEEHRELFLFLEAGATIERQAMLRRLITLQYERNDVDLRRGKFRVRGEVVEIFPAYEERVVRIELSDEQIERITEIDPLTATSVRGRDKVAIYPAKHFVSSASRITQAICSILEELEETLTVLRKENKLLEMQRLETKTRYDIEMMQEIGYCQGIENYSRHLSGRLPGEAPYTLMDYFPRDYLLIIDESHVAIPQIRGMYYGDRSRKETLVRHGFRLPSALDNRPLNFAEFEKRAKNVIYASATPGPYELEKAGTVVEQIIRPTGIVDPRFSVRPTAGQIDDLANEIKKRAGKKQRVLVTTLTKRMSEDLASYLHDMGLKVRYLHSEIDTIERAEILHDLRAGKFDCLVGINLLREGLDLPEVTLVAILDADKEGFLRSQTSLIQVAGRAARNIDSEVLMYADTITGSMKRAIKETERRRLLQRKFNKENNITPRTIEKSVRELIALNSRAADYAGNILREPRAGYIAKSSLRISELKEMMLEAAGQYDFEKAALLRDQIAHLSSQKKKQSHRKAVRSKIV